MNLRKEAETALAQLEEGGRPLAPEDKYIVARFVQNLCATKTKYIPELSRLASVGLLTEVVEDFIKPVQPSTSVDLSIIVDAPLALDYLGCSGAALRQDVACIFDSLRKIGCKIVALPVACSEIKRKLDALLSKAPPARHGYTHNALVRGEVLPEFVQAVANDPERALNKVGITVLPLTLDLLPNQQHYFSREKYEDFFASIVWVADIAPREHDATCLALTMRLRAGHQRSDLFRCKYVFVTRNPRFVRDARRYCVESRLLSENQESPVIHHRELATVAWLRTGLGASEAVPLSHLLATCARVLNLRKEVSDAVGQRLRALTPDNIEQYELLLLDQKSIRRLADLTLNDEKVITDENAGKLLDAMRRATAEEERLAFEEKLKQEREKSRQRIRIEQAAALQAIGDAERAAAEKVDLDAQIKFVWRKRNAAIIEIAMESNRFVRFIGICLTAIIFIVAGLAASNYLFGWLEKYKLTSAVIATVLGCFASYHSVMDALEKPKIGLVTLMNWIVLKDFKNRLKRARLLNEVYVERIQVSEGKIVLDDSVPPKVLLKPITYMDGMESD